MKSQNDEEILSNVNELSEFRSRQKANQKYYKKATHQLNSSIKDINNRIEEYKNKIAKKEPVPTQLELHLGYDWYIDQDEIWRFFIGKTSNDFSNRSADEALETLVDDSNKISETLRKCNEQKYGIKEEIKYLDFLLKDINSENVNANSPKEVKIDLNKLKSIKKKYRIKFFYDFSSWKVQKLVETDIPHQINKQLDNIFKDDVFLFQEYQTYDRDILDQKRFELFDKIKTNIIDYTLKEWGKISLQKVKELIQIQLSVLLISYNYHPPIEGQLKEFPLKRLKRQVKEADRILITENVKTNTLTETKQHKWNGSKSDFARFVRTTYDENSNNFSSRADAVRKLYAEYEFDFKWSEKQCEDLLKKV